MTDFTPLAMAKKLVSYDTTSRDSNLDLIGFAADYLKGLGIDATLIHNGEKTKAKIAMAANVFCTASTETNFIFIILRVIF